MGILGRLFGIDKRVQERVAEVENRMVEISEIRAKKADELFNHYMDELVKAEKAKDDAEPKSYMYDPFQILESLGYKERIMSISYDTLRLMSERNPIVAAIINTRIHQVTSFSRPPKSKYDIGFEITMRDDEMKPSHDDHSKIKELEEMIESTGFPTVVDEEGRDSFEAFLSKITRDSLTYDQACFEIVSGRGGKPVAFYGIDGSTIRLATTPRLLKQSGGYAHEQAKEMWKHAVRIKESLPELQEKQREQLEHEELIRYVQVIGGKVMNTYTEKEMAFGVRNPRTFIQQNGYGVSELEVLISTITAHLWSEEYNKRFFSQGSAPKGMIHFEGQNINQEQLNAFRRQWHAQVAGVWNAWRTPIIASPGKMAYTNLQMSNRQMEFSNWVEYLIKLICAVYLIDPGEINFELRGAASQQAPMFESHSESKLKMSKDRGLRPLLKFIEAELNKNIIYQINPRYEFSFVGLDTKSEKEIQELRVRELERFKTIDEIRAEYDLKPLGPDAGGNLIMDSAYINYLNQKELAKMSGMGGMGGFESPEDGNEEKLDFGEEEGAEEENHGSEEESGESGGTKELGNAISDLIRLKGKGDDLDNILSELKRRKK